MRRNGKVAVLACGYGGGAGALAAMDTKKEIPEEEYEVIKRLWREANPHIVSWWWQVGDAALEATKNPGKRFKAGKVSFIRRNGFLLCELPDGNILAYPRPAIKWDDRFNREQLTYEGVDQNHPKWGPIGTYGPRLVENACQSLARAALVYGMTAVREAGHPIVLHVHDEAVVEVDESVSVEEVETLLATLPPWAEGLPLRADGFETYFYRKDG